MKLISWSVSGLAAMLIALIVWKATAYWLPQQIGSDGNLVNRLGHLPLGLHAAAGSAALVVGLLQLITVIRTRLPMLHRWIGRIYVVACLVGAASGILLAFGTLGGTLAGAGFLALGISWLTSTVLAWKFMRRKDIAAHRRWMIRSFALTFAAVTLRVQIPLYLVGGVPYETAYTLVAWTCWLPNLLVAEVWTRAIRPKMRGSAAPAA